MMIPSVIFIFFHKDGVFIIGPILQPIYPRKKKNKKLEVTVPIKKGICLLGCRELEILPIRKTVSKQTCGLNQVIPAITNNDLDKFLFDISEK